jgi:hypothetical protein
MKIIIRLRERPSQHHPPDASPAWDWATPAIALPGLHGDGLRSPSSCDPRRETKRSSRLPRDSRLRRRIADGVHHSNNRARRTVPYRLPQSGRGGSVSAERGPANFAMKPARTGSSCPSACLYARLIALVRPRHAAGRC